MGEEVAVVGHQDATTSVATKIAYNHDTDPKRSFRAIIIFQNIDSITEELEMLIDTVQVLQAHSPPQTSPANRETSESFTSLDDDDDIASQVSESRSQIKLLMQRLGPIFKLSLRNLEQFVQAAGPDQLRGLAQYILESKQDVLDLINAREVEVVASTAKELAQHLKPYCDSRAARHGGRGSRAFPAWPLVKEVHIFVRVPLLRKGIVLVDLPGRADANWGRVAVAEAYESQLDLVLAMAISIRAASDATLDSILSASQQSKFSTTGLIHRNRLAIVATKSDDIPLDANIGTGSTAIDATREACERHWERLEQWNGLIRDIQVAKTSGEAVVQKLKPQSNRRRGAKAVVPEDQKIQPEKPLGQKELKRLQESIRSANRILKQAEALRGQAEVARNFEQQKLKHQLVSARSGVIHGHILANVNDPLDEVLHPDLRSRQTIKTFDVSSEAYRLSASVTRRSCPLQGFPCPEFSGIPTLGQHIALEAEELSEPWTDALLSSMFVNYTLLRGWATNYPGGHSISLGQTAADKLEACHINFDKASQVRVNLQARTNF
jgi:hypothetical protein